MVDFLTLSWGVHIFIISFLGICILVQTLALVLIFFRYELNTIRIFKILLEAAILLEILVFSLLYGQMLNSYKNGFLIAPGYENIRILLFLLILVFVFTISLVKKQPLIFSIIPATFISLPVVEKLIGGAFPWFFTAALVFFLCRSIKICFISIIGIRTNISALSVVYAIDTLHTGVLFSENDGSILLSNYQMQNLMVATTGKVYRNAIKFYDNLLSDKNQARYKKEELDGQRVYLLKDGSAWMFTNKKVYYLMKKYIHISAAEVTKLWTLTSRLQVQNEELKHKREELKKKIANLHKLSKEKEIENAKMRAHDILGQRLTVLLRIIQNEHNLDYDLLTSLSKGLLAELKAEQSEIGVYDELKAIQKTFATIGVDIEFVGEFPDNIQEGNLFIDIIRESCTNAVRHGFATRINIKIELIDKDHKLTINNNGHTFTSPIIPGSGIKMMREKISEQGGNLNIIQHPIFILSVILPGGD